MFLCGVTSPHWPLRWSCMEGTLPLFRENGWHTLQNLYVYPIALALTQSNATTNHCTVKPPSSHTQDCSVRQPSGKLYEYCIIDLDENGPARFWEQKDHVPPFLVPKANQINIWYINYTRAETHITARHKGWVWSGCWLIRRVHGNWPEK